MAAAKPPTSLILIASLMFFLHANVIAMSSIKAMSKDQIACEFCSACDNPCQPTYSPPPPPPPSPPPPSSSNCPPPPSPPPATNYCPPPPYTGGGGGGGSGGSSDYYPPPAQVSVVPNGPAGYFPNPAPPNPIVPYFPFYYYTPPQPGFTDQISSVAFAKPTNPILYLLLLISYIIFFQI